MASLAIHCITFASRICDGGIGGFYLGSSFTRIKVVAQSLSLAQRRRRSEVQCTVILAVMLVFGFRGVLRVVLRSDRLPVDWALIHENIASSVLDVSE